MTTHTSLPPVPLETKDTHPSSRAWSIAVAVWAMTGVSCLFAEPMCRLGLRAARTLVALGPGHWAAFVAVAGAFVYGEGYRALQKRFAPKVVERALAAGREPTIASVVFAPLAALSLVHPDRRQLGRAWLGVAAIVLAVMIVRALPAPWRGIVDGGVALALLWGLVALWVQFAAALGRASKAESTG